MDDDRRIVARFDLEVGPEQGVYRHAVVNVNQEFHADADGDLSGLALVQRELGATVMTEYDNG